MELHWFIPLALAAITFCGAESVLAATSGSAAIKNFNRDRDTTLDLPEVRKAASGLFKRLDRDHDGTLDRRELRGKLNRRQFTAADPDGDGTISKREYLALVERRFKAANQDRDGTLDRRELNTPAGRALLRLLQ